jgi:hypothetical protein
MNTITIELCKEDRQRLDNIFYNLVVLIERLPTSAPASEPTPVVEETPAPVEAPKAETPVVEEAPAPVAEPAPEVKPVSLAEFQKAVTLAVSKGAEAKQAVKAIINKYAASVSAVPEDKRADIIAELANI